MQVNDDSILSPDDLILVTGSNGFIGSRVVAELLGRGFKNLRCFVRPSGRLGRLRQVVESNPDARVEIMSGDLLSRDDCAKAVRGVKVVYHLAAGIDKSFAGAFMGSALTTRNLIEALVREPEYRRFVNVSSFAVYSNRELPRNATLDESCPLENSPSERCDPYGFGKLKQEQIVQEYGQTHGLRYAILRPGTVFGPGNRSLSGRVGISTFGPFLHMGGSKRLPLTYVDNCAEAIVLAGLKPGIDGEVFNVVDGDSVLSRQFLRAYKQRAGGFLSIWVPYPIAYALCYLWEGYAKRSEFQLPPLLNRRRCSAEWKGNRYSNRKLRERLGWEPRVPMERALELFLSQFDAEPSAPTPT